MHITHTPGPHAHVQHTGHLLLSHAPPASTAMIGEVLKMSVCALVCMCVCVICSTVWQCMQKQIPRESLLTPCSHTLREHCTKGPLFDGIIVSHFNIRPLVKCHMAMSI